MIRIYLPLLGMVAAAACTGGGVPEGAEEGERTASPYSPGADPRAASQRIEGTSSGIEHEAPPLIPAMRQQMAVLEDSTRQPGEHNLTAYRGTAGNLIDAMRDDLARVALPDTGAFRELEDSIISDLKGGPGSTGGPDADRLDRHLDRMGRLIGLYQQQMRLAQQ